MKRKLDIPLIITVFLICIYGIVMIYSASSVWAEYKFNDKFHYVLMQSIFFIIGIILMIIVSKVPYKYYLKKSNMILFICFILLILVLMPGIGSVRNGSRSWFGVAGLGIQPSEFMKLALIIFTSKYIYNNPKDMRSVKKGAFPILIVTMLSFFLIMLQPDFGTGTILVMTIVAMLFISGVDFSFFIKIGMLGMVLEDKNVFGWNFQIPFQIIRLDLLHTKTELPENQFLKGHSKDLETILSSPFYKVQLQ